MAESEQRSTHGFESLPPLKLLHSFISNFLKPKSLASFNDSDGPKPTGVVKEAQNSSVFFPYNPPKNTETLKFKAEGSSGRTSNPFVLWQVYALGGFLVLKWAWARLNERNETSDKKKTPDDNDDETSSSRKEDDHTSHGHVD